MFYGGTKSQIPEVVVTFIEGTAVGGILKKTENRTETKLMAKFSVEKDDEEEESEAGPSSSSSPEHKRQRIALSTGDRGEEGSNESNPRLLMRSEKEGSSSISVTLIDPEVLDCSICMEPLTPPIFQCENGHIACSSCCTKLGNKCASCSWPIGYNRCRAIEKVVESIKVSCQHARYGCKETLSFRQRPTHEETCIYAPCTCPLSDCTFHGSSEQLYLHFSSSHWASARRFQYNCPFSVSLDEDIPFLIFQDEEDGRLFLLNNQTESTGHAVAMTCISPFSEKGGFSYDIVSRRGRSSLRLQSITTCIKQKIESSTSVDFLMVPFDFYRCFGQLRLEVCIWNSRELD